MSGLITLGWFDGAVEPKNPGGHGGWGFLLTDLSGNLLINGYGYAPANPNMTNNVMEYTAAIEAVKAFSALGIGGRLELHGDSKLVVEQMMGRWSVKAGAYVPSHHELKRIASTITPKISWIWVPREQNSKADLLSKKGLEERGIFASERRRP